MATKKKKKKRRRTSAFYDLNVWTEGMSQAERVSLITTALQLGYSGVALNHVVKGPISDAHLCKSCPFDPSSVASAHTESAQFHRDILGVPLSRRSFRLYDRLTVVLDTAIQASALSAANLVLRSYDLVAIRPTSQKVFDQACTHLEVDVISLDFLHRLPLRLKAPSIQAALERGVFFEVSLYGAFQDVKARRELFANAQVLQALTRGRNIIVTSGARSPMDLRGPNDIANLGIMFGLSRESGKLSVSKNCEDAILRGLKRKMTYKSAVIVEKIPAWGCQSGSDEPWFDVPKVWDPLSNTKVGFECSLPEKTKNDRAVDVHVDPLSNTKVGFECSLPEKTKNDTAVDVHVDIVKHTEVETRQPGDSDGSNISLANVKYLEGGSHDEKEEDFLSIDLSGVSKNLFVGSPKIGEGGDRRKGKHIGKQKKRKRK